MAEVAICLVARVLSASVDHMAYVAICHLKSWRTWALPPLGHARQQARLPREPPGVVGEIPCGTTRPGSGVRGARPGQPLDLVATLDFQPTWPSWPPGTHVATLDFRPTWPTWPPGTHVATLDFRPTWPT